MDSNITPLATMVGPSLQEVLLDEFYTHHVDRLLPIYCNQDTTPKYISTVEYFEAFSQLTLRELPEFDNWMETKVVRVDTESPTRRLVHSLSRITCPRAPKGWTVVQTDAGFVKEPRGRVISVGAYVFLDEFGFIRYYDSVILSWVSNEKEAEFETIKFAMYEAARIGIREASFCTDNFEMLKAIQGGDPYPQDEFEKYRTLPMKLLEDYSFIYLPREGNAIADLLTKWRMAMTRNPHTTSITNWEKVVQAAEHQYSGMPNFRIRYLTNPVPPRSPSGLVAPRRSWHCISRKGSCLFDSAVRSLSTNGKFSIKSAWNAFRHPKALVP
ncbi:hypothetical protein RHSIM_Rhsim13G0197100 [Rhododendron simsii]|uniref:Uncharacterized protein n=1 Tax=Rhododendron simsii TaxID=118357 RepID=A0A834L612_RHOSS|nr:hypothetical protein RHSIM_Rhsim13G0197100 [Rhododendron simsii]